MTKLDYQVASSTVGEDERVDRHVRRDDTKVPQAFNDFEAVYYDAAATWPSGPRRLRRGPHFTN